MAEDIDIRRKRLIYQARHRGTQEADLVIGEFAARHLAGFDRHVLDRFEALIGETDADIFDWLSGRAEPPPQHDSPVLKLMANFRNEFSKR